MLVFPSSMARAQGSADIALVNATVVDVEQARLIPRQTVLIRDGHIVRVGPAATTGTQGAGTRVDLKGAYVIPGLWDMHVHIGGQRDFEASAAYYGATFLRNGVTGVRDAGGNPRRLAMFDSIGRVRPGAFPRVIFAGQKLGPSDEPDERRGFQFSEVKPGIAERRANGATYIKLNHGLLPAQFRLALVECVAVRLRCVSHVPPGDTSFWLTAPGRGSYEHLFNIAEHVSKVPATELFAASDEYYWPTRFQRVLYKLRLRQQPMEPQRRQVVERDTTKDRDFFDAVARSGTWFTPTLVLHHQMTRTVDLLPSVFEPRMVLATLPDEERTPEQLQAGRDTWSLWNGVVRAMWRARVNLLAGTDFWGWHVPGASLHGELVLLQDAGIPAPDVLRMATLNPARYLGATDSLGSVTAGRVADLVVLRRNPLEDIRHVADIDMVVTRGHLLQRAALDSLASVAIDGSAALRRQAARDRVRGDS